MEWRSLRSPKGDQEGLSPSRRHSRGRMWLARGRVSGNSAGGAREGGGNLGAGKPPPQRSWSPAAPCRPSPPPARAVRAPRAPAGAPAASTHASLAHVRIAGRGSHRRWPETEREGGGGRGHHLDHLHVHISGATVVPVPVVPQHVHLQSGREAGEGQKDTLGATGYTEAGGSGGAGLAAPDCTRKKATALNRLGFAASSMTTRDGRPPPGGGP